MTNTINTTNIVKVYNCKSQYEAERDACRATAEDWMYIKYPVGYEGRHFEWTLDNILTFVNYYLGGDFDAVRIADPAEYRVFKNCGGNHCNFGD